MEYTRYVARRRARFNGYGGRQVNIPRGEKLEAADGDILFKGVPLCGTTSENARQYFSQDDDGMGKERGDLVNAITARLEKRDGGYQARWDKVWADPVCQKYRQREHEDHWLWDIGFYAAPVEDLRKIARLVGAREERKQK